MMLIATTAAAAAAAVAEVVMAIVHESQGASTIPVTIFVNQ
jgi:hypothetical protein